LCGIRRPEATQNRLPQQNLQRETSPSPYSILKLVSSGGASIDAMSVVLLVDDEAAFRSLYRLWLEANGFEVRVASDGVEGLASVLTHGWPDAALMDVNMPRLDGLELCRLLRRADADVPLVLVSAREDLAVLGRYAGASAVLTKPSSAAELSATLQGLLPAPPAARAA
jgi:CheY-like chemotaxis protein